MTVLTGSKIADPSPRYLLSSAGAVGEAEQPGRPERVLPWAQGVRTAARLAGLLLGVSGVLLGLGVVWTQLARALPLTEVLDRPRAVPALLLIGAGLGLLRAGRHAGSAPETREPVSAFPPDDFASPGDV